MNNIFSRSSQKPAETDARADEQLELTDLPLTPIEGWISVISLSVMLMIVGIAIDDARWSGVIGSSSSSQTGFLPICGIFAVLVGVALAKSKLGKYTGHLVGSLIGAAFLLNAVSTSVSIAPSIAGRLHDLNLSVSTFVEEVVVLGVRTYETSIFLLVLGALVWAAGLFSAYAVFRRHRPLPAILLTGFLLLINVSITIKDQYLHLIIFMAAALVLVVRLNLLDQAREWRSRGMRDVADISGAFMRNGAAFVVLAIIAATTLAANASSAPLSRAWHNLDDDLLEVGFTINRWLGGVSGSARGPNILFTPTQTIGAVWESSTELVFTATTTEPDGNYWRGATYDSFDGDTWQQLDRQSLVVDPNQKLLIQTADNFDAGDARHAVQVQIVPADYGGDWIVAPADPLSLEQPTEIQTNGPHGPFVAAKLVYGVQQDVPYGVASMVRDLTGSTALTGNELAAAGTDYPDFVNRYLEIRPGSVGEIVSQTADAIRERLPDDQRDPYHLAVAVQDFLYRSGGFEYKTDVRGVCGNGHIADCLLEKKVGYCEYFATTMVMLLRELNVPARYVLGYLPGREQPDKTWLVDRSAAHTWVEVYFPGHGWIKFDPTPGNAENGQSLTRLAPGPEGSGPVGTREPPEGRGELECADRIDCGTPGPGQLVPPTDAPQPPDTSWTSLIVAALVGLFLLLLGAGVAIRRLPATEPEIAYRGIARLATRLGHGPQPAQTAYEFAGTLGELVPVAAGDLQMIATAKVEATYGRRQPGDTFMRSLGSAYRRVRIGLLRLLFRKPAFARRPRSFRKG